MRHSPRNHDLIWVRDDSPVGEGKYAVLNKTSYGYMFEVEEVDNGFQSNDKFLMEVIDSYWYFKNKRELNESLEEQRKEQELTN
jgi:hypothetical protein